ncbi:Transcription factor IWS1 [Intoshia linei]|uniref:Transcription factor IWS1 n=1 Tax=Intoshia linei TaxID=1819745 RepID=A0A177B5L3_9BILA|nr:Transcription factor IWS1 [Intoshia linei]
MSNSEEEYNDVNENYNQDEKFTIKEMNLNWQAKSVHSPIENSEYNYDLKVDIKYDPMESIEKNSEPLNNSEYPNKTNDFVGKVLETIEKDLNSHNEINKLYNETENYNDMPINIPGKNVENSDENHIISDNYVPPGEDFSSQTYFNKLPRESENFATNQNVYFEPQMTDNLCSAIDPNLQSQFVDPENKNYYTERGQKQPSVHLDAELNISNVQSEIDVKPNIHQPSFDDELVDLDNQQNSLQQSIPECNESANFENILEKTFNVQVEGHANHPYEPFNEENLKDELMETNKLNTVYEDDRKVHLDKIQETDIGFAEESGKLTTQTDQNKITFNSTVVEINPKDVDDDSDDSIQRLKKKSYNNDNIDKKENKVYDFDVMFEKIKKENQTGKKRYRQDGADLSIDMDSQISKMIADMSTCATEDRVANTNGKPAVSKLKYLSYIMCQFGKSYLRDYFLDANVLSVIVEWLTPLPNRSLTHKSVRTGMLKALLYFKIDSVQSLRNSQIGKSVMYLYKHPKETTENKKLAKKLIHNWSRIIFNLSIVYSKNNIEDSDFVHEKQTTRIISNRPKTDEKETDNSQPQDTNFDNRARVPQVQLREYRKRPISGMINKSPSARKQIKSKMSLFSKK